MYRYIYVIERLGVLEVLFKVFHVSQEQALLTLKVFVNFSVLVEHVDHYFFLSSGKVVVAPYIAKTTTAIVFLLLLDTRSSLPIRVFLGTHLKFLCFLRVCARQLTVALVVLAPII